MSERCRPLASPAGPKAADDVSGQAWGASSEFYAGSVDPLDVSGAGGDR